MKNSGMVFDIDLERCVGCYACVVACMDQNDIDIDAQDGFRSVSVAGPANSVTRKLGYVSMACMHCGDAPCASGCPTGCLQKDANGLVVYDTTLCIGCRSCMMNCPYGAPRFDPNGKISKCDGCAIRVENGLIPACVRVCPAKSLKYDTVENIEEGKKLKSLRKALGL